MGGSMMEEFEDPSAEKTTDSASWRLSVDNLSSEGGLSSSLGDMPCDHDEDGSSRSDGSSRLGWPLGSTHKPHSNPLFVEPSNSTVSNIGVALWDEKREKRQTEMSEIELMKERFAKLLLGEDMSGRGKGVPSALAISNAITNLSASVFGEIWRLEPLSVERTSMWRREMEWLLSVADHVVELVPSWQTFPDGNDLEVMVTRPRSDLHINLPALRKLDAMLLESLETFSAAKEFWYVEQGIVVRDEAHHDFQIVAALQRQEEKWWLPCPRVPVTGLSTEMTKHLKHQRECVNQILKAALAINNQTLSEMEVPTVYWDALPKNGKASIGESLYRRITSHRFSTEAVICSLNLTTEFSALEVANRIEAAIHVWRRKKQRRRTRNPLRNTKFDAKASWALVRDFVLDVDRREFLAGRAERLLICLKQKFPDLPQSLLDMSKIQHNRDIGQSILESYSRVIESLAYNIIARIEDVLHTDEMTRRTTQPQTMTASCAINSKPRRARFTLRIPSPVQILSPTSVRTSK